MALVVPLDLDLTAYRATGLQPGEALLPDDGAAPAAAAAAAPAAAPEPLDETLVAQLASMGFDLEACRRTAYTVRSGDFEAAVNYLMAHLDDPGAAGAGGAPWRVTDAVRPRRLYHAV